MRLSLFSSWSLGIWFLCGMVTLAQANELSLSDQRFVSNAVETARFEIEASSLAFKKSKDTHVLRFAKMMTDDHGEAGAKLKSLAANKGAALPRQPSLMQQSQLKLMMGKEGVQFNQSYAKNVGMNGHEQAIELFENAAQSANDADIKKFAADQLPVLKKHLEAAKQLVAQVSKEE